MTIDVIGIIALLAATGWGCYILLNRSLGQRLPGLEGTALATAITAASWSPVAAVWFASNPPTAAIIGLALACGLMSLTVPYVANLIALRRVPAHVFGAFLSVSIRCGRRWPVGCCSHRRWR